MKVVCSHEWWPSLIFFFLFFLYHHSDSYKMPWLMTVDASLSLRNDVGFRILYTNGKNGILLLKLDCLSITSWTILFFTDDVGILMIRDCTNTFSSQSFIIRWFLLPTITIQEQYYVMWLVNGTEQNIH